MTPGPDIGMKGRNLALTVPELIRINSLRQFWSYNFIKSTCDARELSMISHGVGAAPVEFPQKRDVLADHGDHGPMSQQDAVGSHGHEMHPQKFLRLVGSHGSGKDEAAYRLH